jgi:hypothetical protein
MPEGIRQPAAPCLFLETLLLAVRRLRIEYDDVMSLTSGLYKEGAELPPLPGSNPRFEI